MAESESMSDRDDPMQREGRAATDGARSATLIMPTHNRADLLPLVFETLAAIELPSAWQVDMVVVVNACVDDTEVVLERLLPTLPFAARQVVEPEAGSSHARNRGIEESSGDVLVFLDDDVLVDRGWLVDLLEVMESTGADFVGGPVKLWWQAVERPPWFGPEFDSLLAAKDHGDTVRELDSPSAVITINTAYRRRVVERIGGFRRALERRGKGTGSFEDIDFNTRALDAGFRLFYAPRATVRHWVEPSRMTLGAMTRMIYFYGQARVFAKPRLSLRVMSRSLFGNLFLLVVHVPGEGLARLRGQSVRMFRHRWRWSTGAGGLVGLTKRLAGRESGY